MPEAGVNYVAVFAAAVIYLVLGFLWYGPLFGRRWMQLMQITPSGMNTGAMVKTTVASFIGAVVMLSMLARVVLWGGAATAASGAGIGALVWLAFVAAVMLNTVLYERRPWALYVLNTGYYLVSLVIAGALFAVWR